MKPVNPHIKEKSVIEHLASARKKGYLASVELHNLGFSSKLFSFMDAFRDGIIAFGLIAQLDHKLLWAFVAGLVLWKGLKTSLQGFMRLERLHYLVKEEKYEIDHNRDEERRELMAIYEAKGFKTPLLEEVVATLMADDNRLLQVMLEEEMGVSFETLDHPVMTGATAAFGMLVSGFCIFGLMNLPYGIYAGSIFILGLCAAYEAYKQKLSVFTPLLWNLASLGLVFSFSYYLNKLLGAHA